MRFCGSGEAKELSEMAWDIWVDHYAGIVAVDMVEHVLNVFQSEEAIVQQIRDGHLYSFIEENDVKAGYLSVVPEGDSLFISKLYISRGFRGKRVGSAAMDEMLEYGREKGMKKAYLRVNRHNLTSIEFYKHKGFICAREDKKDIGDGYFLDDYIMEYYF